MFWDTLPAGMGRLLKWNQPCPGRSPIKGWLAAAYAGRTVAVLLARGRWLHRLSGFGSRRRWTALREEEYHGTRKKYKFPLGLLLRACLGGVYSTGEAEGGTDAGNS